MEKRGFLIGTAAGRCDWLISGNPAISHIHAEIICREGRYYLLDRGTENRGSTNGTCFFGERLLPGVPQELSEDCLIRLADEAFSFRIPIKPLA